MAIKQQHRHFIVTIDSDEKHNRAVYDALFSFYNVSSFNFIASALAEMRKTVPDLLLIGEGVTPSGGLHCIHTLRQITALKEVPIIFITDKEESKTAQLAQNVGANSCLSKPYRRNALINAISALLNAEVEKNWENLPELQRDALKNTVSIFNNVADTIANGEQLPFGDIRNACAPLIESVRNNDFKGILNGVKDHDNYTYAHSMRVATLLSLFGHAAGLKGDDQVILASGGLLHDVGKMKIPHYILNKRGKLTEDEFLIMKSHVPESITYLEQAGDIPKSVITIAGQHHEKLSGEGYPYGLKARELNELVRMAAIVDVFSALTDRRVYKPPMPPEQALTIMSQEMGGHLDQSFLKMFRDMLLDAVCEDEKGLAAIVHNKDHKGCC